MNNDAKMLDKRVIQRNLVKGRLKQQNVDEYLKSLPDLKDSYEELMLDSEEEIEDSESEEEIENEIQKSTDDLTSI